jgi:hypothetical protein
MRDQPIATGADTADGTMPGDGDARRRDGVPAWYDSKNQDLPWRAGT